MFSGTKDAKSAGGAAGGTKGAGGGTKGRPSLIGLLPGIVLAGLVILAGGYYSLRNIGGIDVLPVRFVGSILFLSFIHF